MRARYGVSVVILKSDMLSAIVIAMLYLIYHDKLDHAITAVDCIIISDNDFWYVGVVGWVVGDERGGGGGISNIKASSYHYRIPK